MDAAAASPSGGGRSTRVACTTTRPGPIKLLGFARRYLTLGLPILRTSPDHGTAFDIAGRNRADATSISLASSQRSRDEEARGMSRFNPAIFREYDIRGVSERDFDADFARRLGHAYARYRAGVGPDPVTTGRYRIGVGGDCRLTSPGYAAALRAGLCDAGLDVVDLGVCPTPLVYFALFDLDLDGAIQVTGSHNPADQNGFDLHRQNHGPRRPIQDLRRCFDQPFTDRRGGEEDRGNYPALPGTPDRGLRPAPGRPLRIVVDAGNATAGPSRRIFRAMGCEVTELYCELDGRFQPPSHPTVEENLADLKAAGCARRRPRHRSMAIPIASV
jgi:phosphomannomutase